MLSVGTATFTVLASALATRPTTVKRLMRMFSFNFARMSFFSRREFWIEVFRKNPPKSPFVKRGTLFDLRKFIPLFEKEGRGEIFFSFVSLDLPRIISCVTQRRRAPQRRAAYSNQWRQKIAPLCRSTHPRQGKRRRLGQFPG